MKLEGKTNEDLVKMMEDIESDPSNQMPPGSFWKMVPAARKKIQKIQEQITHNLAMKRAAAGNPVQCDGYSGRKSNKR